MPRLLNKPFVVEARTDEEMKALCQGVRIYVKNKKAAVGTAKGIAEDGVAHAWEEDVEHLETGLVARLTEQQELFTVGKPSDGPLFEGDDQEQSQEEPAGAGAGAE